MCSFSEIKHLVFGWILYVILCTGGTQKNSIPECYMLCPNIDSLISNHTTLKQFQLKQLHSILSYDRKLCDKALKWFQMTSS